MEIDVEKIQKILAAYENISFAYLFGSFARGTATGSSDVDIAIFFKDSSDTFDTVLSIHHELEIALGREIDLIVLNDVKNYALLKDILDHHIVLIESHNETRQTFELKKHHEILDYIQFKRMIYAD